MIGAERTCPLLVPVTVTEYVPGDTLFLVSTINVDVPEFVIELGLNLAVTNFGKELIESVTVPVNPLPGISETTYVVLPFLGTVLLVGETEIEKSPTTTSVTLVLLVIGPLVPLIVSV